MRTTRRTLAQAMTRTIPRAAVIVLAAGVCLSAQVKEFRPSRFNLFSPQQDVEMGKEAAAEVRQTMPLVNNAELTAYVTRIGQRLAKSPKAGNYPYTFEVVNDPSINAFALPGGPVFVNTGLLAAVDNESELAGVLAHELSHAALRHGTSQVSKANLIQLPAMLGGAMLGGQKGIWASLGQLGIGLGMQSALLRNSRAAEKEADLNGAQIMNDVGYDPSYAAEFFQKLEERGNGDNSLLANLFASHPTPGNRVQYVQDQNRYLPKRDYSETDPGALPGIQRIVASLPPPPKPAAASAPGTGAANAPAATPADVRPSGGFISYSGRDYSLRLPDNWQVLGDPNAATVTVAPRAAMVADAQGQTQIAYGILVSHYYPENQRVNLARDTADLVKQIRAGNANTRQTANSRRVRVAGQAALVTSLESPSPYRDQRELDMLVTLAQDDGLFYMVFIAPESEWPAARKSFDEVVRSLRFSN